MSEMLVVMSMRHKKNEGKKDVASKQNEVKNGQHKKSKRSVEDLFTAWNKTKESSR
jgi:hypothetical protein